MDNGKSPDKATYPINITVQVDRGKIVCIDTLNLLMFFFIL